jgi:DNA replication protein DnaC
MEDGMDDRMTPLDAALRQVPLGDVGRLTPAQRETLELVRHATTSTASMARMTDAAAALAAVEARQRLLPDGTGADHIVRAAMHASLVRARRQLEEARAVHAATQEQARRADALGRPAGCWCLGLGGRGVVVVGDEGGPPRWSEWCVCPEAAAGQGYWAAIDAEWDRHQAAEEAAAREETIQRRLREARLTGELLHWSFESFPAGSGHQPLVADLQAWVARERFPLAEGYLHGRGLYLVGRAGRGKTGLAVATLRRWIEQGGAGRFIVPASYFDALRASFDSDDPYEKAEATRLRRDVHEAPLLVLDDFGAEGSSEWVARCTFEILNYRMNAERPTIITSNHPIEVAVGWLAARQKDPEAAAERLTSRLLKMCEVMKLAGGVDLRVGAPVLTGR